jgi:hypothetical protein
MTQDERSNIVSLKPKPKADRPSIVEFVTDPQLLNLRLSGPQEVLLRSIFGLALSAPQREIFTFCTGRENYPGVSFQEATVLAGARAGKDSRIACPIASYEACFGPHEKHLAPGEHAVIPLVAPGSLGTRVAYSYIKSHFTDSRLLRDMLEAEPLQNEIKLRNRVNVMCFPSTKASLRGWSIPCGILDEIGFFRMEGAADSDAEIQASIRRGMINFPTTRLLKVSTPFSKSGLLYDDFKNHYGKDSPDVLVWRAGSTYMNPSLRESRLEAEKRKDPQRFAREFLAEFSEDLDTFLPSAWIDAAVVQGRHELPPSGRHVAAVDVSGLGSGPNPDAFTLCVVHVAQDGKVVQDCMKGWRKGRNSSVNIAGIIGEIKAVLTRYGVSGVHGDSYGAEWVVQRFAESGVTYLQLDKDKSFYYLQAEPLFAQGKVELLDNAEIQRELRFLERRMMPGGRVRVDHPRGCHDDHSNSFAIAATLAAQGGLQGKQIIATGSRLFSSRSDWLGLNDRNEGSSINAAWDSGSLFRKRFWDD